MNSRELTRQLAEALGLPAGTVSATLALGVDHPPQLRLEVVMLGNDHRSAILPAHEDAPARIRKIKFMLRLEPFEFDTTQK